MSQSHVGTVLDVVNGIEIIDCTECKFKHALITKDFPDVCSFRYFESEKPNYISLSESENEWWELTYCGRISKIDSLTGYPTKNWIDIGTGPGLFLDALKVRNRIATGIEPSIQAFNHAISKKHNVINAFFDSILASQLGEFDAGHLSEVLEHIPNPQDFLRIVKSVIKPGGYLCIVVPNDYNPIQKIFIENSGEDKWWLAPPFHLNYFDKISLEKLILRSGFEVVHSTAMFPIDFFLLMGDVYIGNDEIGKAAHERRKRFEHSFKSADSLDVMHSIYDALASIGIGRELVIFAKNPE